MYYQEWGYSNLPLKRLRQLQKLQHKHRVKTGNLLPMSEFIKEGEIGCDNDEAFIVGSFELLGNYDFHEIMADFWYKGDEEDERPIEFDVDGKKNLNQMREIIYGRVDALLSDYLDGEINKEEYDERMINWKDMLFTMWVLRGFQAQGYTVWYKPTSKYLKEE